MNDIKEELESILTEIKEYDTEMGELVKSAPLTNVPEELAEIAKNFSQSQ